MYRRIQNRTYSNGWKFNAPNDILQDLELSVTCNLAPSSIVSIFCIWSLVSPLPKNLPNTNDKIVRDAIFNLTVENDPKADCIPIWLLSRWRGVRFSGAEEGVRVVPRKERKKNVLNPIWIGGLLSGGLISKAGSRSFSERRFFPDGFSVFTRE